MSAGVVWTPEGMTRLSGILATWSERLTEQFSRTVRGNPRWSSEYYHGYRDALDDIRNAMNEGVLNAVTRPHS